MFVTLLLSFVLQAKTIRVAIVDTGYNTTKIDFKQCDNGHYDKDFTETDMNDREGHGNNVLHIITEGLEKVDYCIIALKVIDTDYTVNVWNYNDAMLQLLLFDFDVLNISMNGDSKNEIEKIVLKKLLDKGVTVVVAAGNDHKNLSKKCAAFPACNDKRIVTVGCLKDDGINRCTFSNYGKPVKVWEKGMNVEAGGITLSGTSQSTARATNKIIKKLSKKRK